MLTIASKVSVVNIAVGCFEVILETATVTSRPGCFSASRLHFPHTKQTFTHLIQDGLTRRGVGVARLRNCPVVSKLRLEPELYDCSNV